MQGNNQCEIIGALVNRLPFIFHEGIACRNNTGQTYIVHNTPFNLNEYGGSLFIDPFSEFTKTRTIIYKSKTHLTDSQVLEAYNAGKYRKFDLLTNNCEHFVTKTRTGYAYSPQLIFWCFALLFLVVYFKNRKL